MFVFDHKNDGKHKDDEPKIKPLPRGGKTPSKRKESQAKEIRSFKDIDSNFEGKNK